MLEAWQPTLMRPLIVTSMVNWKAVTEAFKHCHHGVKLGFDWNSSKRWLEFQDFWQLTNGKTVWLDCETGLRKSGMTTGRKKGMSEIMVLALSAFVGVKQKLIWYGMDALHPRPGSLNDQIKALSELIMFIEKRTKSWFVDSVSAYQNWNDIPNAGKTYGGPKMWVDARIRLDGLRVNTVRLIYIQPNAKWKRRKPFGLESGFIEVLKSPGCIVYPGWNDFEEVGRYFVEQLS